MRPGMAGRRSGTVALLLAMAAGAAMAQGAGKVKASAKPPYVGFDRNDYPGDEALAALSRSFRYTSYWLNPPPGEKTNSWTGKRATLRRYGFGFLVLYSGRSEAGLKMAELKGENAGDVGASDGKAAVTTARREGFPRDVLIFLDQEEGGRLLEEQAAYVFAWVDAVRAGGARAGVYCSGIEVTDSSGTISTAEDIAERESAREGRQKLAEEKRTSRVALWIADDACPPSPGCTLDAPPLTGTFEPPVRDLVAAWQYAQSPRRKQFSASCPANDAPDGNCYAPGLPPGADLYVDLDTANSADPSGGAR